MNTQAAYQTGIMLLGYAGKYKGIYFLFINLIISHGDVGR
jgi:hypothetical protein